ncbi:phage tail assembly protein [Clostridiaceae bacterium]|nr:phage tail assembly protein [Clostridiaceae bacterium]
MSKDFERENMEQTEAAAVAAEGTQDGAELEPGVNTTEEENAAVEAAEAPQDGNGGEPVELVVKAREKKEPGAEKAKGTYTHTFRRPVKFEGKTYKTLTFYWDNLTGADMISIENEMQDMNEYALSPEMSASFLAKMAAKAAGVGSDFIEALPVPDFTKIRNEARSFLVSTGY